MKKAQNMKTTPMKLPAAAALLLSAFSLQPSALLAQGSLTPPGAPAPMMKTLAQIEPRTPISSAPFTITNTGSYYLTTNLTVNTNDAIIIVTNGVTLDLNGFTISSTAGNANGSGIRLNDGLRDLTIFNGHIRGGVTNNGYGAYSGSGFALGIYCSDTVFNTRISGVSVSGCAADGINIGGGNSTVVESCTVRTVSTYGILASTIKCSVVEDCGSTAISGEQVSDCRGRSTGSGSGIHAVTALNCHGASNSGYGLLADITALNCYGESSSGTGLYAATAQNCQGSAGSAATGLLANMAFNCYGSSATGTGLRFNKIGAMCRGERALGMISNYVLGTGMAGPVNLP